MQGFDPEFPDLDTYIRVITARIWLIEEEATSNGTFSRTSAATTATRARSRRPRT